MRAIAVTPGRKNSARLTELPDPVRQPDEHLVRVLDVGVDGTDREINSGLYGAAPAGEDVLIVGHESIGVVQDAPGGSDFPAGSLVVATVRRPDPQLCPSCRSGEYDFCSTGNYRERGIKERHGYMAEFYSERAEFLVHIPRELRKVAVLLEPLSVLEKAYRQVQLIQRRTTASGGNRVMITGAGSIGIFAALLARLQGRDVLIYSRGPKRGTRGEIMDTIGARYTDATTQSLENAARAFGPDLIIEATGYSPFAWQCATAVRNNGVVCLLSVTAGKHRMEIDSDRINEALVLGNRLLFGSVSSHCRDFQQGVTDMQAIELKWPGLLERFITRRLPLEKAPTALEGKEPGNLKTLITISD